MVEYSKKIISFSNQEYQERLVKTRKAMANAGIDLLFVEDPSNMAWLTGYDGWSFYVHQGVVITHDSEPWWWGRLQDAQGARITTYLADDHIRGYDDLYVQSSTIHPMEDLAKLFKTLGYEKKSIGVEMDNYYFSAKAYTCLKKELPNAHFLDATSLVNWIRAKKSPAEISYMEKAAQLSEIIINKIVETAKLGMKKNDLVAEIYSTSIRGTGDVWGDYAAIVPLLPSGYHASAPHLTWNDEVLKEGEATFVEIAGCYRRYHTPLCRTIFLGKPDKKFIDAEKALVEGLENGIEIARPGNKASDVARKLYDALEKYNIKRSGRCGYAIGLSYPPDWGERTISLRIGDETILEPNMTFHFMPGLWMDSWGVEITESIQIKENGPARCFNNVPRKIFLID